MFDDTFEKTLKISIHALLAESDNSVDVNGVQGYHFYPRSPCGERHHFCGQTL